MEKEKAMPDVLAWVEEHGGLDAVKKRLMPEGMEWLLEVWPKWSNGEYCKFGDWWVSDNYGYPKPKQFRQLSIYTPEQLGEWGQGDGESYGYEWDFVRPSNPKYRPDKVEPPAPKVLDAYGAEIRVGDTVYLLPGDWCDVFPCLGYHGGEELEVFSLNANHVEGGISCCDTRRPKGMCYPQPSQLTHTKPEIDTWERLEEDAEKDPCDYFGFDGEETCGKCPASGKNCEQTMALDLVRRARALAERERGE